MFQRARTRISEMVVAPSFRTFRWMRRQFWEAWGQKTGKVDIATARSLYRNDKKDVSLGGGFTKRIINAVPEFMGLPWSSTGDENVDELLNDSIHVHWSGQLVEAVRDACRDSKTVIRLRQPSVSDPLASVEEINSGFLEVVPPENVEIFYEDFSSRRITRALVTHVVDEVELNEGITRLADGQWRVHTHTIIEEITPDTYRYWDEEQRSWDEDLQQPNTWGFVPLVEFFNDEDAYLEGGQSDLTAVYPFLSAFHDVLAQALISHKQHSIPKAMFRVGDIGTFLVNNFPDSFDKDENGQAIPGSFNGTVNWKGTEILFFQPEEGAEFLEARSVLGDSKTLAEFLLDCIVIASETPRWILMLDVGAADKAETLVFVNKIRRKRINFTRPIQQLCKMILAVNNVSVVLPKLEWEEIDPMQMVNQAQALQMFGMALELALERQLVSDTTAREALRKFIPNMKSPGQEEQEAKSNMVLSSSAPNSPSGRNGQGNPANVSGAVKG